MLKVAKFGGTSVADSLQIEKIKSIVEADGDRRYIVVSAPGKRFEKDSKVTDLFYLFKNNLDANLPSDQIWGIIRDRFIAEEIALGNSGIIGKELDIIKQKIEDGETIDYIVSRGEYLNAVLIAKYLGFDFVDAKDLIVLSDSGRPDIKASIENLKKELKSHERAVIPGFYGTDKNGKIKTFSRGGSDITGALVAAAVNADIYENWTDVSGFLMADPRIIDNPKKISKITYKELRELSYMGAKVLHEEAIFPAKQANIPINIRNTNDPADGGTLITSDVDDTQEQYIIKGIAGSKDFTDITIYKEGLSTERGFVRKLAEIMEDFDITLEHIPNGIDTISAVLKNELVDGRLDEILERIQSVLSPDQIEADEDLAIIATVGHGMSYRPGTAAKLFSALARNDINIRMIDQGSSELNIIVGVKASDFEKAIEAIYREFVK